MRTLSITLALTTLAGCEGSAGVEVEPCTSCVLSDGHNFAYTSTLDIGVAPLRAQTDGLIRWDGLTRDVRGGALDPVRDLDEGRLIAFRDLPMEEIEYGLAHDDLAQADVSVYVTCSPRDATCALSDFGMFGNTIDIHQYFQEGYGTWLLALGKHGEPGADALVFLEAQADTESTSATLTDTTSRLGVDVDLDSLTPLVVPTYEPELTVTWADLTRDGLGDTLDHATLDELWVARFTETPEELAQDVFALEERAQVSWTLDVDGQPGARLADLQGETTFTGVDGDGTWLMALRCRTCTNPAPRFVTLLQGVDAP